MAIGLRTTSLFLQGQTIPDGKKTGYIFGKYWCIGVYKSINSLAIVFWEVNGILHRCIFKNVYNIIHSSMLVLSLYHSYSYPSFGALWGWTQNIWFTFIDPIPVIFPLFSCWKITYDTVQWFTFMWGNCYPGCPLARTLGLPAEAPKGETETINMDRMETINMDRMVDSLWVYIGMINGF